MSPLTPGLRLLLPASPRSIYREKFQRSGRRSDAPPTAVSVGQECARAAERLVPLAPGVHARSFKCVRVCFYVCRENGTCGFFSEQPGLRVLLRACNYSGAKEKASHHCTVKKEG
ncbi:hypothetical protein F7725_001338, partial [Dissostichus mawsoni]